MEYYLSSLKENSEFTTIVWEYIHDNKLNIFAVEHNNTPEEELAWWVAVGHLVNNYNLTYDVLNQFPFAPFMKIKCSAEEWLLFTLGTSEFNGTMYRQVDSRFCGNQQWRPASGERDGDW